MRRYVFAGLFILLSTTAQAQDYGFCASPPSSALSQVRNSAAAVRDFARSRFSGIATASRIDNSAARAREERQARTRTNLSFADIARGLATGTGAYTAGRAAEAASVRDSARPAIGPPPPAVPYTPSRRSAVPVQQCVEYGYSTELSGGPHRICKRYR